MFSLRCSLVGTVEELGCLLYLVFLSICFTFERGLGRLGEKPAWGRNRLERILLKIGWPGIAFLVIFYGLRKKVQDGLSWPS